MIAIVVALAAAATLFFTDIGGNLSTTSPAAVDVSQNELGNFHVEVTSLGNNTEIRTNCGEAQATIDSVGTTIVPGGDCETLTITGIDDGDTSVIAIKDPDNMPTVDAPPPEHTTTPSDPSTTLNGMDGDGTKDNPFIITNVNELQAVNQDLSSHYELGNDIDARGTSNWNDNDGFTPIGDYQGSASNDDVFEGSFNGNGHTIYGLTIDRPNTDNVAMFEWHNGYYGIENVTIDNADITGGDRVGSVAAGSDYSFTSITVTDTSVTGNDRVGGLVGKMTKSSIENSKITGNTTVTGTSRVGGLVGAASGELTNVSSTATVSGEKRIGGLVGNSKSTAQITKAHATGDISGTVTYIGGLIGYNDNEASLTNTYATGDVTGPENVGGLIGSHSGGTLDKSYATGNVTGINGTSTGIGGLTGTNLSPITNSYATGNVEGTQYVGGLVGESQGKITDTYATGDVTADTSVGGLIGYALSAESTGVTTSYATGAITGNNNVGGLLGEGGSNYTSTNSYWDSEETGHNNSANLDNTYGLSTTQMQENPIDNMTGFNFGGDNANPWTTGDTNEYPSLWWQDS